MDTIKRAEVVRKELEERDRILAAWSWLASQERAWVNVEGGLFGIYALERAAIDNTLLGAIEKLMLIDSATPGSKTEP